MSRNSKRSRRRSTAIQRSNGKSWLRRYFRSLRNGVAVASLGTIGFLSQPAYGANATWIGNADPNFATTTNWSVFPLSGDTLIFGAPGTAGPLLLDNLMTAPTYTLNQITFNAGAPTYTINAAAGTRGFTFGTGGITNNSTSLQNFNDNITINTTATVTMTAGGGNLSLGGVLTGPGSVVTAGSGTLTLSGNNTFAGGIALGTGITLNINRSTAVGTGAITVSGNSTIDNTSGGLITLANNNASNINADLTFTGTNNLNLGTGTVTLGGAAGQRTVTVNAGTLTMGPIKSFVGSGTGLSVAGSGILTIAPANNGNGAAVQSVVEGNLDVAAGSRINTGQDDTFFGGLTGSGTVANGSTTSRWMTVGSNNTDTTFSGSIINGGAGNIGLRKRGTGNLTLNGANTISDQITVENGTLTIGPTGSINSPTPTDVLVVGNTLAQKAILKIQGNLSVRNIFVGNGNDPSMISGAIYQTSGTLNVLNVANVDNFRLGIGAAAAAGQNPGYGYYKLSGGAAVFNEIGIGGSFASDLDPIGNVGVADMTGGSIEDNGWVTVARGVGATGILNITGGVTHFTNAGGGQLQVGGQGGQFYGVVNISNATVTCPVGANVPINLEASGANNVAGAVGIANLGPGGLLRVGNIQAGASATPTSLFNFLGGTLQASVSGNFITNTNLTDVVVYNDSATATKNTIDNNGKNITISRSLSAPTGSGVTSISVDSAGSGYIGAPAVVISGGGRGATAVANMVQDPDGTYHVGSITITSPGTDYSGPPTVTLKGGGFTTAATAGASVTTAANIGGGMIFTGSGVTTLSGSNSYTGPTRITSGTLLVSGSIDSSSGITINGAGAKLRANSTINAQVTVTTGTLDGVGTVNNVTVGAGTGGVITNGNGVASVLSIPNLTFSGAGTWSPVTSDTAASSPALSTTTITTTGAGSVTVSPINTGGAWSNNTYTLASYSTLGGTGFPAFTSAVAGLGGRQTQSLTNDTVNSLIKLTIGGNYLIWTGATNANWQLTGSPNWNLSLGGGTTYQATSGIEDAVVFDDTATGSKTISLSSGTVSPPRVTFNNTSGGGDYVINGPGAIGGSGSLFVNGTGAVTLNSANTFSGGVTVSNGSTSGTLKIGNNTAIGTGPLTLGLNSTIDAAGAARTLTNNNAINVNGDFTFTGTNNLDLGTGPMAITFNPGNAAETNPGATNSTGTTSTFNVAAGTLTIGGPVSGPGVTIVKTGAGKLVFTGAVTHSQTTIIHNGELVTSGSLGTINQNIQISPYLTDNGSFTVNGGTVTAAQISISGNAANALTNGAGTGPATMTINGGTVTAGTWFTVGGGVNVAGQAPVTGTFNMNGGTLTINTGVSGAQFEIGNFANMTGIVNQTGGDISLYNNGRVAMLANAGAIAATYNMSGGTLTGFTNGGITHGGGALNVGVNAGTGIFNFSGGTIWMQQVTAAAAATTTFNFDGGTLKAAQANGTFISNIDNFNISQNAAGPVTIDDNGVIITIPNNILHGAFAATDAGIIKQGIGTMALTGTNTFNGGIRLNAGTLGINSARAIGTGSLTINAPGVSIDNTGGAAVTLTSVNPQFWNNDFTYAGTASLNMGTGPITLNATRTVTTNLTNAGTTLTEGGVISGSGFGLIKAGPGNLALTGANAYTGPTTVSGGTLTVSGSGSINASSGIAISGGRLLQISSTAMSPAVALNSGTLDGTTTVNTVNVGNTSTAIVTHGNGATAPITIGALNFAGAGTLSIRTSEATAATPKIATTSVSTNAAGNVVINAINTGNFWLGGATYSVLSYSGAIGGAGFNQFLVGQFAGLGARQTVSLTNPAGLINAVIGGDTAIWTGAGDGNWDLAAHSPKNWKLSSSGTPTDFVTNDATEFQDGAVSGIVNLTSNVSAAYVRFTNTTAGTAYTLQSAGAFGISSGSVFLNGTGSVTIANNNTYSGGTTLNSGTLNVKSAGALGTGPLSLNGGTIDNTSGALLTLSTNNAVNLNGNVTFTGTNDLTLGTGTVTLVGSSSLNTVAGVLTTGPIFGTGNLTKSGAGTWTIVPTAGNGAAQTSTISGDLIVNGGLVNTGLNDTFFGGLIGSGTVANGSTTTRWMTVGTDNTDTTFSGTLVDGAGATAAGGNLGLRKRGSGTLTLSGNNTLSEQLTFESGRVLLTGSIIPGNHILNAGPVMVGTNNAAGLVNGILEIQGGNLQAKKENAPSLQLSNGAGTAGALRVGPGSTLNSANELWIGQTGGFGAMDMTGGTVSVGSWLAVGRNGAQGVLNLSGGSLTVSANPLTIGSLGASRTPGTLDGLVNLSGGTLTTTSNTFVGEQSNAVMNVSGSGHLVVSGAQLELAVANATNTSTLNLLGGIVTAPQVTRGAGQGTVNFNGGTLQASVDTLSLITTGATGVQNVYVYNSGANIDTGGHAVTLDATLQAPTGNGVSATGLSVSGGGFISTPLVFVTGGGGTGATANANIDTNGNLTGITITNPGVGYTSAPTFALSGGGIGNTGAISGTATLVANVSGGLTKTGAGTLTITGANTFAGSTTVQQGTLQIGSASAVPVNTRIVMNGGKLAPAGQNLLGNGNTLQVASNSGIDMAGTPQLIFADSHLVPWTAGSTVSILNWTGNINTGGGASELIFGIGGLTTGAGSQVSQIHFQGFNGATLLASGANAGEVVPTSVSTRVLGDWNVSGGTPTAADLPAMLTALTDLNVWKSSHSLSNDDMLNIGDINLDGKISNADIQAELDLLSSLGAGATAAVPEPSTCVLLVLGAIPGYLFVRRRRKEFGSDSD